MENKQIKMVEVKSSHIARVGYSLVDKRLLVEFNSGVYEYENVPERIYTDLLEAESKGKYIREHIINEGFKYHKLLKSTNQ